MVHHTLTHPGAMGIDGIVCHCSAVQACCSTAAKHFAQVCASGEPVHDVGSGVIHADKLDGHNFAPNLMEQQDYQTSPPKPVVGQFSVNGKSRELADENPFLLLGPSTRSAHRDDNRIDQGLHPNRAIPPICHALLNRIIKWLSEIRAGTSIISVALLTLCRSFIDDM
ncbi:MAG: hypothetical protein JWQ22_1409 [Devosia sp.]|nr:hypothetical protein [Devosia sp.]